MRLRIFNCSPKGRSSNSRVISGAFTRGFCELPGHEAEEFLVAREKDMEKGLASFGEAGVNLVVFPVYVDAMPGLAKQFIERLAPLKGRLSDTRLLFLVHTGFPEETHTRPMERYLNKLAVRLGANLDGVIRLGGGKGIKSSDSHQKNKALDELTCLGRIYAVDGKLDARIMGRLAGPSRIPMLIARVMFPIVNYFGFGRELRKNGAWERRFDRPL